MRLQASMLEGQILHVRVQGEIDLATSPDFKAQLVELVEQGHTRLLLDLLDVRYIDSSGLIALVVLLKRLRTCSGRLVFLCVEPSILRVFRLTGLTHVLEIAGDLQGARMRFALPQERAGPA